MSISHSMRLQCMMAVMFKSVINRFYCDIVVCTRAIGICQRYYCQPFRSLTQRIAVTLRASSSARVNLAPKLALQGTDHTHVPQPHHTVFIISPLDSSKKSLIASKVASVMAV